MSIYTKAIGQIPPLKVASYAYKSFKTGYKAGTYLVKKTGIDNGISKYAFKTFGPASQGLIRRVDQVRSIYHRVNHTINRFKPFK